MLAWRLSLNYVQIFICCLYYHHLKVYRKEASRRAAMYLFTKTYPNI